MKRFTFKTTQRAKDVITAVADIRHHRVSDLIHAYFYELAKSDLATIDYNDDADTELSEIFNEAIQLD